MKHIFVLILLLAGTILNSGFSSNNSTQSSFQKEHIPQNDFKLYTLTGSFQLGSLTYTYTIVIDATICIICNPPTITINGVESLSICLQGTSVCGSWGVTRIVHDSQNNLEFIEFWVDNIQNEDEVERYMNDEDFQQEIKDKLLNYE